MKKDIAFCMVAILFFVFLFLAYEISQSQILGIDSFFIEHVVLHGRNEYLTPFFKAVTFCSSIIGIILLTIVTILWLKNKKEKILFLCHLGGAVFISQGLKFLFQRERPLLLYHLVEESGYSFPSGHSMIGTSVYGYFIYLLWKGNFSKRIKIILSSFMSILIVGIGFSRIYLGVHYVSDVLAGIILGICYTTLFVTCKEYWKDIKKKNLMKSFYYAGTGIFSAFLSERNMKIHVTIMCIVVLAGFYFQISVQEWITCIILFGTVISAEIMNTAIETVVDMVMPEIHPKAKLAKDLAAGAVLILAIIAVVIGLMIFLPKI